jgi:xanthine dehydrogenase YagS FAD-binding subunit
VKADVIEDARVALGGVAHKPWRDPAAEDLLKGRKPETPLFLKFADQVLAQAKGQGENDFKIELARRAIVRALHQAAAGTPQDQSNKSVQ